MTAAFVAAMDEANALIAENKPLAAQIFVRSSRMKVDEAEVLEMLKDPDARFSTTPTGVTEFAQFMHLAGSIKTRPAKWSEMFIPLLKERPGS